MPNRVQVVQSDFNKRDKFGSECSNSLIQFDTTRLPPLLPKGNKFSIEMIPRTTPFVLRLKKKDAHTWY